MYGCQETNGIAMQCKHGHLHLMEGNILAEIYNNGSFSKYGTGNMCVTGLHNSAMPFIRYKLNDTVTISKSYCTCGDNSPIVSVLSNRFTVCTYLFGKNGTVIYPASLLPNINSVHTIPFRFNLDVNGSVFSFLCDEDHVQKYSCVMSKVFEEFGIISKHIRFSSTTEISSIHHSGVLLF